MKSYNLSYFSIFEVLDVSDNLITAFVFHKDIYSHAECVRRVKEYVKDDKDACTLVCVYGNCNRYFPLNERSRYNKADFVGSVENKPEGQG